MEDQHTDFAEVPAKFEAGTQNVGGATGLSAAIDYLEGVGFDTVEAIEKDLVDYALPLIQGETKMEKVDSLPRFAKLKKVLAK